MINSVQKAKMATNIIQVTNFLKAFKGAVNDGASIQYISRVKNWEVLSVLGFTLNQRTETILSLKPTNYIDGPIRDKKGRKGRCWVFGNSVNNTDIYIKIKLIPKRKKGPIPICISFHIADYPLSYPLKGI